MKITEKLGAEFILPLFNDKPSENLDLQFKTFVNKVVYSSKSLIKKKMAHNSFPRELLSNLFLGKNSRSRIIFLIGQRYKIPEQLLVQTSCVVELLHEASLIHDDLQDRQEFRRDLPTVWKKYSDSTAISWGDFLLSLALEPLLEKNISIDSIKAFNLTVQQMLEGQNLEQVNKSRTVTESDYYKVIDLKTSSLLRLPMLLLSEYLKEDKHQLIGLASNLGKAYQIQNDNIDFQAQQYSLDFKNQIGTLPFIKLETLRSKKKILNSIWSVNASVEEINIINKCLVDVIDEFLTIVIEISSNIFNHDERVFFIDGFKQYFKLSKVL